MKKYSFLSILLFPLSPFLGFVISLKNFNSKTTKILFVIFFALIGCSFKLTDTIYDSYRYAESFVEYNFHIKTSSFNRIDSIFTELFSGKIKDVYFEFLKYTVSFISSNPRVLFAVIGAIFGLFAYKSLVLIKEKGLNINYLYLLILLLTLFSQNIHTNINGVRFWTATYYFFFTWGNYLETHNKKWLYFALLSPLFHNTFILPIIVCIAALFLTNKLKLLSIIFLATYLLREMVTTDLFKIDYFLGDAISIQIDAYLDPSAAKEIAERAEGRSLLNKTFTFFKKIYPLLLIPIIWGRSYVSQLNETKTKLFFSCVLCLFIFANIVSVLPTMGRFYVSAYMMLVLFLTHLYNVKRTNYLKTMIILLIPFVALPDFYITISFHKYVLDPIYIYGNIISIIDKCLDFKFQ